MGDSGEARLDRKKPKQMPPSAPPPGEGGRGRDRFQPLWQDYHDLPEETEAKKRRLEHINQRKAKQRPPPVPPGSDSRFQSLWQDYHELLKETEAKKRRLEYINQRKLGLLAEVKFLQKKYSSFAKDDSEQTHHRLKKKKAQQIPSTLGINEGPSTSKNTDLDLNHVSAMNAERTDCQGYQDNVEPGNHDQAGVDEDIMTSNVNSSVYRDTGNSPASDDKRAAAWQDRVALEV